MTMSNNTVHYYPDNAVLLGHLLSNYLLLSNFLHHLSLFGILHVGTLLVGILHVGTLHVGTLLVGILRVDILLVGTLLVGILHVDILLVGTHFVPLPNLLDTKLLPLLGILHNHLHYLPTNLCNNHMKIHVFSMLAIGADKHTQQTNKQPQWLH